MLGHNYMEPLVFGLSTEQEQGDSLALSMKAVETDSDIIIFNGVRFMAETAKVLNPNKTILIADKNCIQKATFAHYKLEIPNFETDFKSLLSPFLMAIPAQLLAYHVANERGTDVDQPRNLAKSVTVE